jgi:hypothetical protein
VVLHGSIFRSQVSKLIVRGAALTLGLSNETDFLLSMPGRGPIARKQSTRVRLWRGVRYVHRRWPACLHRWIRHSVGFC